MPELSSGMVLQAVSLGGSSCLISVTELEPAAGPHASVAPAKFASDSPNNNKGAYAHERRFLDGESVTQRERLTGGRIEGAGQQEAAGP